MVCINRIARKHTTVLCIEDEHEPHEDIQQPCVDLIRVIVQNVAQEITTPVIIGGLEASKQFIERAQHLLRELGRDRVLVFAALGEDRRQSLLFREAKQSLGGQQQM